MTSRFQRVLALLLALLMLGSGVRASACTLLCDRSTSGSVACTGDHAMHMEGDCCHGRNRSAALQVGMCPTGQCTADSALTTPGTTGTQHSLSSADRPGEPIILVPPACVHFAAAEDPPSPPRALHPLVQRLRI